jgi:hypothetical protein
LWPLADSKDDDDSDDDDNTVNEYKGKIYIFDRHPKIDVTEYGIKKNLFTAFVRHFDVNKEACSWLGHCNSWHVYCGE